MTILQQKNLGATSEENRKHRTPVASTSRQTLEGPIPFVATTAPLHQSSSLCKCGAKAVGEGSQNTATSPLVPSPMNIFH